jgi:N-formylglutamate amidohydrolase
MKSDVAHIDWIPEGTSFGVDEITYFVGRDERSVDDILGEVDLIITGPHASAAFPAELQPFVESRLTKRLQYDFTDISTSPITRRWAQIDPHVLYIEDPHPRAVRDANRSRPTDLQPGLREAFDRLDADPDGRPPLQGIDAVRPVTFGYLPVLLKPETDEAWNQLVAALVRAGALGIDQYERIRDDLVERVIEAKLRRLATLDPTQCTVSQWRAATHLDLMSMHDTMNHTARPDGAVCLERQPVDRLPAVVALSNHGDANGELASGEGASLREPSTVPSMRPDRLRTIGRAYQISFDAWGADDVAYNRPYAGGHETATFGPLFRELEPRAVVRSDGISRRLRLGVWQNEFLREFLLGPEAAAQLARPGTDWVFPPDDRVGWIAERLRHAHDLVRVWGDALIR